MVFLHVRGTRVAWQHLATENEALNIVMRGLSKNDWKSNHYRAVRLGSGMEHTAQQRLHQARNIICASGNMGRLGKKSVCIHRKQDLQENEPTAAD